MMRSPARFSRLKMAAGYSAKAEDKTCQENFINRPEGAAILGVKSQRAIAARLHNARYAIAFICPRPGRQAESWRGCAAPGAASRLTPARWDANRVARQLLGSDGLGEAVPSGTGWNRAQNHQTFVFVAICSRFQRFRARPSRDVRTGVGRRTCVYARGVLSGTLEPLPYIYTIQLVNGSKCGSSAVPTGTGPRDHLGSAGKRDILGGGYWQGGLAAARSARLVPLMHVERGSEGAKFGDFGLGRSAGAAIELDQARDRGLELLELGADLAGERNGGFLPFLRGRSGHVGRAMLEGWAQRRSNAWFLARWPLPVRLERGEVALPIGEHLVGATGGSIALDRPPVPPAPRRAVSIPVAPESAGIWIDLRPDSPAGQCAAPVRGGQHGKRSIGSGKRENRAQARMRQRGRGDCASLIGWMGSRRAADASGGLAHVN